MVLLPEQRYSEYLEHELSRGSTIELHRFKFSDFHILMDRATETYELISVNALCNPFIRKLVENISIVVHDARYCEILNVAGPDRETTTESPKAYKGS
jgi:hypothetical protein